MHPNPVFRARSVSANLDFARARGFGMLMVNGSFGPFAAHLPFHIDAAGGEVLMHLTRSNAITRLLDQPLPALLAVSGPDAYVSPDWYGMPDQAPTWNYVAVHLRGAVELLPQDRLMDVLDQLSAEFETRLAPKAPWLAEKMNPDLRERLMRSIVPVRMVIDEIDGTWKLAQNKEDAARMAVADAMQSDLGHEVAALAALMRQLPEDAAGDVDSEEVAS